MARRSPFPRGLRRDGGPPVVPGAPLRPADSAPDRPPARCRAAPLHGPGPADGRSVRAARHRLPGRAAPVATRRARDRPDVEPADRGRRLSDAALAQGRARSARERPPAALEPASARRSAAPRRPAAGRAAPGHVDRPAAAVAAGVDLRHDPALPARAPVRIPLLPGHARERDRGALRRGGLGFLGFPGLFRRLPGHAERGALSSAASGPRAAGGARGPARRGPHGRGPRGHRHRGPSRDAAFLRDRRRHFLPLRARPRRARAAAAARSPLVRGRRLRAGPDGRSSRAVFRDRLPDVAARGAHAVLRHGPPGRGSGRDSAPTDLERGPLRLGRARKEPGRRAADRARRLRRLPSAAVRGRGPGRSVAQEVGVRDDGSLRPRGERAAVGRVEPPGATAALRHRHRRLPRVPLGVRAGRDGGARARRVAAGARLRALCGRVRWRRRSRPSWSCPCAEAPCGISA